MTRDERLRRCLLLCAHFASNVAYYRARRLSGSVAYPDEDFWDRADGNFIDTAVLEWCKIFGDPRAEHSWQRTVTEPVAFKSAMLGAADMDVAQLDAVIAEFKRYRDKFLAHLDSDFVMQIPHLEPAYRLVRFFYGHVRTKEIDPAACVDAPLDLETVYQQRLAMGAKVYTAVESVT